MMDSTTKEIFKKMNATRDNANGLEGMALDFIEKYQIKSRKDLMAIYDNKEADKELDLDGLDLAVRRALRKIKRNN